MCINWHLNILSIATARTKSYRQQAFACQGPINWNRVPGSIRIVVEKDTFKKHWKTALFSRQDYKDKYIVSLSFYIIIYHRFFHKFIFLIVQYYFHVTVSHFGSFVAIINISLTNMYYVLCMCCLFVVVQFKCNLSLHNLFYFTQELMINNNIKR